MMQIRSVCALTSVTVIGITYAVLGAIFSDISAAINMWLGACAGVFSMWAAWGAKA